MYNHADAPTAHEIAAGCSFREAPQSTAARLWLHPCEVPSGAEGLLTCASAQWGVFPQETSSLLRMSQEHVRSISILSVRGTYRDRFGL